MRGDEPGAGGPLAPRAAGMGRGCGDGSGLIGTQAAQAAAGRGCAGVGALGCARARCSPQGPWQRHSFSVAASRALSSPRSQTFAPRLPPLRINKTAAREGAAGRSLV